VTTWRYIQNDSKLQEILFIKHEELLPKVPFLILSCHLGIDIPSGVFPSVVQTTGL
jgi:hypothetical protein